MRAISPPHRAAPPAPAQEKPGKAQHVKRKPFAVKDARPHPHPKKPAKKSGKAVVAAGSNAPVAAPPPLVPGLPAPVKAPDGGPPKTGTATGKGALGAVPARGSPDVRHPSPNAKGPVSRLGIPSVLGTIGGAPPAKPVLIRQVTLPPAKPVAPSVLPTPAPPVPTLPNSPANPPTPAKSPPVSSAEATASPATAATPAVPAPAVTLSAPTASSASHHHARTSPQAPAPPLSAAMEPHAARGWVVRPQYWHHQPGADVSRWKIAPPAGQGQPMILTLTQARDSFQARLDVTPPDGAWVAQAFAPLAVHALQGQMNGHGVALSQLSVFTSGQGAPQGGGQGSGGLFESGGRWDPPTRPGYQPASGYTGGHGEGVDYRA